MTIKRWATRRDGNDTQIAEAARRLGWYLVKADAPCDYWGLLKARAERGFWPIEVKVGDGRFTSAQKFFRQDCLVWHMPYLTWRTVDDVVLQTNALIAASNR